MTEQALFERLLNCLPPHLTAITVKPGLQPAYLPGPDSPIAERASAMPGYISYKSA